MQRIVLRYRKESAAGALSHSDLRACLLAAADAAALPLGEGRRTLAMGPPLPPDATSEAEQAVLELDQPQEPSEVSRQLNAHLPSGVRIVHAWVARHGSPDENPGAFDLAVYDVMCRNAQQTSAVIAGIRQFLLARDVTFTRTREKKVQQFNARAFVRDITLVSAREGRLHLRMTVSVGPQGTMRPEEVLQLLGLTGDDAVHTHRIALLRSAWRRSPQDQRYWL